MFFPETVVSD